MTRTAATRALPRTALLVTLALGPGVAAAVDVRLCTSLGAVELELDDQRAPANVANFLRYAESGFYSGTVFHRVVAGELIQGGLYDRALQPKPTGTPVRNESGNGLSNRRGTIAASRSDEPDSATAAFFFNLGDNLHLDGGDGEPGYTVFGRVTAGLDVLDRIGDLPAGSIDGFDRVPQPLVEIFSATVIEPGPLFGGSAGRNRAPLDANLAVARARGDAAGVLQAAEALRQDCFEPDGEQRIAEAEAAIALGRLDQARDVLAAYLATATSLDPDAAAARRLFESIAGSARGRTVDELLGHCPEAFPPAIPDGRSADGATLEAIEAAVRSYRADSERYLRCAAERLAADDLNAFEAEAVAERHNDEVVSLTAVLTRFNRAVRAFRGD